MANKTKKMTIKYWNSLDKSSKKRALTCVFPLSPFVVDMLLGDKPNPKKDDYWKKVFRCVRQPIPTEEEKGWYTSFKTIVKSDTMYLS